jgi:alpha-N-acetylglucosaminidase
MRRSLPPLMALILLSVFAGIARADVIGGARGVIDRAFPGHPSGLVITALPPRVDGCDAYDYVAQGGTLTVRGTTAVAACRGFYDYLRANGMGMVAWSGTRAALPARWPDAPATSVATPYVHRFYLNPVTYGYTMPYWTWDRWQRELDWMALHGVNMPLALVGTEAIGDRVWKQLGLTQAEVDPFYTGPAHLPWQRMGNLAGLDGPLPPSWHADQIALQHQILDRMRQLGIEPIAPSFAGFVPEAFKAHHPEAHLHRLGWAGFPPTEFLAPDDPLFAKIGAAYVKAWEAEFGKARYFLCDSFNEMELPKTGRPVTDLLADYGDRIYSSLRAGDPDAVWVVQGWMFGYQRQIWTPAAVRAMLSRVPDDRMLILDEACDYNAEFWHNGMNWRRDDGFDGKPWVYGVIPNMGGKTAWTGVLDFYATDPARTLASAGHGRMAGVGFAPEGIENNEVIYELMADTAWRSDPIRLDDWLPNYCRNRYGGCPPQMAQAWDAFRQTSYGTFTDHPRFGWQTASFGAGSENHDPRFVAGVQRFLAAAHELGTAPLYRADALQLSAAVLGLKADEWFGVAREAQETGGAAAIRDRAMARGLALLGDADRLLASHPLDRLQPWLDLARAHGATDDERDRYEADARRIVTVWGPPEDDYSARVWSGLIRDFYAQRMRLIFDGRTSGHRFDRRTWEEHWVAGHGVSPVEPFPDPLAAAAELVDRAATEAAPTLPQPDSIGGWTRSEVSTAYKTLEWPLTTDQLRGMTGVRFHYTGGACRLNVRWAAIVTDGREVARDAHDGYAGLPDHANVYALAVPPDVRANNGCVLRASVCSDGGTDSRGVVQLLRAGH